MRRPAGKKQLDPEKVADSKSAHAFAIAYLARRVLKESASNNSQRSTAESLRDARIAYEARLVLSRDPTPEELEILRSLFTKSVATPNRAAALKEVSMKGNSSAESQMGISNRELDGLKAVGSVLLNLDAALNR